MVEKAIEVTNQQIYDLPKFTLTSMRTLLPNFSNLNDFSRWRKE